MEIRTKQAEEFGRQVTLYLAVDEAGWTTLWHSTEDKAIEAWARRKAAKAEKAAARG